MPDDLKPRGTFSESEAVRNPKLDDMDLKDLRELTQWPSKMDKFVTENAPDEYTPVEEVEAEAPPEPTVVEEPITEPEPVQAEAETEPAEEVAPEPEAPVESEKTPEPPTSEDIDRQLLLARVEAMEADNRKLAAQQAGREAGESGYIKQLQRQIEQLKAGDSELVEETPSQPLQRTAEPDSVSAWVIGRAVTDSAAAFADAHSDTQELAGDIGKYLQESGFQQQRILDIGDPIDAGREMTRVLEEAYWHVKSSQRQQVVADLQKKRADSMPGLEMAKRKAASSASGASSPPPKPAKKTDDLSLKDLAKRVGSLASRR